MILCENYEGRRSSRESKDELRFTASADLPCSKDAERSILLSLPTSITTPILDKAANKSISDSLIPSSSTMAQDLSEEEGLADAVNPISRFLANEQISDLHTCPPVDCIVICVSALVIVPSIGSTALIDQVACIGWRYRS